MRGETANGVAVREIPVTAQGGGRRRSLVWPGLALAILSAAVVTVAGAKGLPWFGGGRIVALDLVARNMRFNETNPPIAIRLGDTLRLALTNAEPAGIAHDLVIVGPEGLTSKRLGPGETQVITFTPPQAGAYHYSCSLHPRLMDGEILVRP